MPLTTDQNNVVDKTNGHVVVLAGPGSGKTYTIIEKIIYIFENDIIPEYCGLLAITFTNAAANEMRSRLRAKGFQRWDRIWIGTFHSFGSYLLSCYGSDVGIQENFELIEKDIQNSIIDKVISENSLGVKASNFKSTLEGLKRRGIYPGRNDEGLDSKLLSAYIDYQKEITLINSLDFGDLVALAVRLLEESNLASRLVSNFFQYIIVDEFQDSDSQQLKMICLLAKNAVGSTIVADDDQSIYRFRGAVRENVFKIKEILKAEAIILGINFRSDKVIVEAAKSIIEAENNRASREIKSNSKNVGFLYREEFQGLKQEAHQVAAWIAKLTEGYQSEDWGEIAIITRNRWRVNEILSILNQAKIPWFDRSRLNFQDSWEIFLGLAILSLSCNLHSSDYLHKVFAVIENEGLSFRFRNKDALEMAISIRNQLLNGVDFSPNPDNIENILDIAKLEFIVRTACWSSTEAGRLLDNLHKMLDTLKHEAKTHQLSLLNAINRLAGHGAIQVMSGHASKGREFDYVFLAGLEDDTLPFYKAHKNAEELAEERRIFYVSITRARKAAYLTSAAKINSRRKRPSRFISHIPQEYFSSSSNFQCIEDVDRR